MKNSTLFLGLRHLRGPLIVIVAVFAAGIAGLVLIPGTDEDGHPWHMTFSQALYFMSYTATTIGFGEIPQTFNETQRLWVTAVIFASVVGWTYLVGSILALLRDEGFRGALTEASFARAIHGLREPFYLICGFGETGLLVARTLDHLGYRFAVIDIDPVRIQELNLLDLTQDAPSLCADARFPEHLMKAGLVKPECTAVLALTNDDQANLAVAMAVRLLNPATPVLARAMSREVAANMASFGTDHIVNPFTRFGAYLALALATPASYRLISWLTALPDTDFDPPGAPPRGHWVVCGYGRFGRAVVAALRDQGLDVSVIDPGDRPVAGLRTIKGTGTEADPLIAAGIRDSVGIIAGTDDDITNLSILVTARELNADLFTILRQNLQASSALCEAFAADITMVSSEIVANDCVAIIKTPRLADFLAFAQQQPASWAETTLERLGAVLGTRAPEIWGLAITADDAPAVYRALTRDGHAASVGDLSRNPADRKVRLPALALALIRDGALTPVPDAATMLDVGDQLLFAGTPQARWEQARTLKNINVCEYLLTGADTPGSWFWRRLKPR